MITPAFAPLRKPANLRLIRAARTRSDKGKVEVRRAYAVRIDRGMFFESLFDQVDDARAVSAAVEVHAHRRSPVVAACYECGNIVLTSNKYARD